MIEPAAIPALMMSVVSLIIMLLMAAMFASLFWPWMQAFLSGAPVMIIQLLGMRLRGVPPRLIVDALVMLVHRGYPHDQARSRLAESIYLAHRVRIQSADQLADMLEERLKAGGSA
jgi:uncharacterized protein YqfA (UPF0365 family)